MPKPVTYEEIIKMLAANYEEVERSVANQILLKASNHYPTEGSYRESIWKSLFEMIIPRKYCIEQGVFIIDSYGHKSKEVDLVVFDEMYTPYIFNYGKIKFIPIEAVAAVVQCKSNEIKYKKVADWRKTIEDLITSMDSVARTAAFMSDNSEAGPKKVTQTATRPIMILCAINSDKKFSKLKKEFDIILSVDQEKKKINKYIRGEENSLSNWNDSLNHALDNYKGNEDEIKKEKEDRKEKKTKISAEQRKTLLKDLRVGQENVLLSLTFQLNQLLMVLNNPMLFPHRAYAKRFDKILNEYQGEGKEI